jgi:dTDP-glucose pyrophosphorylase
MTSVHQDAMSTVILAAGQKFSIEEYSKNMVPVRGKPAIAWVVESAAANGGFGHIAVVLDRRNQRAGAYLRQVYPGLRLIEVEKSGMLEKYGSYSILTSLIEGIEGLEAGDGGVRVLLGDTLCPSLAAMRGDAILVSSDFDGPERWCMVEADERRFLKAIYDQRPDIDAAGKYAVIGVYQFLDRRLLKALLARGIMAKHLQMSALMAAYNAERPICCLHADTWIDLGHRRGIVKARGELYNLRGFNSISADTLRGSIAKSSADVQKISDEHAWFTNVPDEIKALCPRIYGFQVRRDAASGREYGTLLMEMYGYPALSELFILGNFGMEEWKLIIGKLFDIHRLFTGHRAGGGMAEDFRELYIGKTFRRIRRMLEQDPYWEALYARGRITVNGREYDNIRVLEPRLRAGLEKIAGNVGATVIHGDFHFANILFDVNNFICRLVDPRGRLKERTIYGDPRYDVAKLRHTAVGEYNFAAHGLFSLSEEGGGFTVSVLGVPFQAALTRFFDDMTQRNGYSLDEIKLIEAALFVSMIPLHSDDMRRQKLFYVKAVQKLNECLNGA